MKRYMWRGLLALLLLALVVGVASVGGLRTAEAGGDGLAKAIAAQERHTDALLAIPGVVGTGVGHGADGKAAVFVLTENPGVRWIPGRVDGVTVAPLVTGEIVALERGPCTGPPSGRPPECNGEEPTPTPTPDPEPTPEPEPVDPTARFDRPVPIGVSTGHPDITAGTIGARVVDSLGNVYALSNNHVYADSNEAEVDDPVLQPGAIDGGTDPADRIGTLANFVPIDFGGGNNVVDAAIALSSTSTLGNATPSDGYGTPKSTTVDERVGLKVQKYGRTTGLTKGRIGLINVISSVNYGDVDGDGDNDVARFVGQILVRGGFSAGGDSGSLVVDQKTNEPVGLLFAGSDSTTIINPIDDVLAAFGVTIDGAP